MFRSVKIISCVTERTAVISSADGELGTPLITPYSGNDALCIAHIREAASLCDNTRNDIEGEQRKRGSSQTLFHTQMHSECFAVSAAGIMLCRPFGSQCLHLYHAFTVIHECNERYWFGNSVRPSVRDISLLYRNGWTYRQNSFIARSIVLVFCMLGVMKYEIQTW